MDKKRLSVAAAKHQAWLRSKGLHLDQLKNKPKHENALPNLSVANTHVSGEGIPTWKKNTRRKSVIEELPNENASTQAEIIKKMERIDPAYSKGSLQYIPNKKDLLTAGRKV